MDKLRLNLGCGAIRPKGWVNADSSFNAHLQRLPFLGKALARALSAVEYQSDDVVYMNLNKRWNYKDSSVDIVYASHLFEHLTIRSADRFLKESFRCMKKGGVIRLVVPDLHQICQKYLQDYVNSSIEDPTVFILWAINLHKEAQYAKENFIQRLLNEYRGYPHQHKFMYDDKSLALRLKSAGFSDIRTAVYGESHYIPEIKDVEGTKESYLSAYVEAKK